MTASSFLASLPPPRIVETALGPVSIIEQGSGPVVIAIHGAMGGCDQSAILAAAILPSGRRIISVSRPGFPGTPLLGGKSARDQAARVLALVDALKIEKASIVAISGGGPCAIHMAIERPDLCASLILVSTVAGPNPVDLPARFTILRALSMIPGVPNLLGRLTTRRIEAAATRAFPDPAMRERVMGNREIANLYLALTESTFRQMSRRVGASMNDFHVTATESYRLESIQVPTLIVHGDEDPFVDYEHNACEAERRISNATIARLRGGGHAAIFTHRAEARSAVAAFLSQIDRPSSGCPQAL